MIDFEIEIVPSQIRYRASTEHTLLDEALSNRLFLQHSCKKGQCGVCVADVVSGLVKNEHGECVDSGAVLTCSSYAQSDVRLSAQYYPELTRLECKTVPCKVASCVLVAKDILILKLRFPPTVAFDYLPGQYIDLSYQGVRRSYSIANARSLSDGVELHIRLLPDGQLSRLLTDLQLNQLMRIEGPKGTFFVRDAPNPLIFLAGGTGFAPVKAMLEDLLARQVQRDMYIYWGMPVSSSLYTDIANTWALAHKQVTYVPVISGTDPSWVGRRGLVHQVVLEDFLNLNKYHVYACGSALMCQAAKEAFVYQGLKAENFYQDAFVSSN